MQGHLSLNVCLWAEHTDLFMQANSKQKTSRYVIAYDAFVNTIIVSNVFTIATVQIEMMNFFRILFIVFYKYDSDTKIIKGFITYTEPNNS